MSEPPGTPMIRETSSGKKSLVTRRKPVLRLEAAGWYLEVAIKKIPKEKLSSTKKEVVLGEVMQSIRNKLFIFALATAPQCLSLQGLRLLHGSMREEKCLLDVLKGLGLLGLVDDGHAHVTGVLDVVPKRELLGRQLEELVDRRLSWGLGEGSVHCVELRGRVLRNKGRHTDGLGGASLEKIGAHRVGRCIRGDGAAVAHEARGSKVTRVGQVTRVRDG